MSVAPDNIMDGTLPSTAVLLRSPGVSQASGRSIVSMS